MKRSIFILSLLVLFACDPEHCIEAVIENKTSIDLNVKFFDNTSNTFHNLQIKSSERGYYISEEDNLCSMGSGASFLLDNYDSIVVSSNSSILKVYYPDNGEIYRTKEESIWKKEVKNNISRYTFTIKEEDIFDTAPKE